MQKVKDALLFGSVLLNIILVASIVWLGRTSRQAMDKMVADAVDTEIRIQQYVLTELESRDPKRIDSLRNLLMSHVAAETKVRYRLQTGEPLPGPGKPAE